MFNRYFALILYFLFSSYLFAEVSVFGAGDLNSPEPYGLDDTEKVVVKTKTIATKNEKTLKKTRALIRDLKERLDGVESILDGESQKLNKLSISFKHLKKQYFKDSNIIKTNTKTIATTQETFDTNLKALKTQIQNNTQNIQKLRDDFEQITQLVNEINKNYVTKKDFKDLLKLLDKKLKAKKPKKKIHKSLKQVMKDARKLFAKSYLTKAMPLFELLVEKKYRPAESNYYLGEIYFRKKQYKDALYHYKKSMTLYDKAKYLPKLLLHSAVSFDKIGDTQNAQNFYSTLIEIYPNTPEAKQASKKIK